MPRKADPNRKLREKMNLTIHPEIRDFADQLAFKRRRSVSQLFEDLVEAEWHRMQAAMAQTPPPPQPAVQAPPPVYAQPPYPQTAYYYPPQFAGPVPSQTPPPQS